MFPSCALLHDIAGMAIISGYPCDLYDKHLYARWARVERKCFADGTREPTEVVWMNPAAAAGIRPSTDDMFTTPGERR